uniref:Reverse transcriptase/retrotransposon-derived protein RNase H-like domain-containing protein n=1 Tax=Pygocentrus nattereri TaxID=42514 RepID=A0AAR2JCC7_PYGNA
MPRPTDVKEVQRLVGMVNYLSKFYAHLSDDCEILRQLTHKDNIWDWTPMHEEAFTRLKINIAKAPVLKYYSPKEEVTLQCDASETGLGAALTQNGKPVAFASRALTTKERGYAQIEKECLAIETKSSLRETWDSRCSMFGQWTPVHLSGIPAVQQEVGV